MKDIEFMVGQIVHKPHPEFKGIFVPMQVTKVNIDFHGDIHYLLKSKENSFSWITMSHPEFIKESNYFLKELNLIDKDYESWLYSIGGQI